jgi:environmental stress-induced protein Ves
MTKPFGQKKISFMKIYDRSTFKLMPWKNGKGETLELLRYPESSDFFFRLSSATIASDGPFSLFPGVDRLLMLLSGGGVHLRSESREVRLEPFETCEFKGEEVFECTLRDQAVTDFNVMVKRNWGKASLKVSPKPQRYTALEDKLYLYSLSQETLYELERGERIELTDSCLVVSLRLL